MSMSYMELIERVKPHPEIWQLGHPLFKNKIVRIKFWNRLSKELKTDEQQLRKNWKYLADQYRREYKKTKAQENAVGEPVKCGWAYYEPLSFLKPGAASKYDVRPVKVISSDSDNNDSTQDPSTYASYQDDNDDNHNYENASWQYSSSTKQSNRGPGPSVSKADLILRKLQSLDAKINSQPDVLKNDEDYMFFMSVLPMVRTLTPLKKLQLRGKINNWLLESLSEREADPLNSMTHYAVVEEEEEDNKQALRDQIMAAEDDDDS